MKRSDEVTAALAEAMQQDAAQAYAPFVEIDMVREFTKAALSGSAVAGVFRHDFNAQKTAILAVEIAKEAVRQLRSCPVAAVAELKKV